jgi:DNA primase
LTLRRSPIEQIKEAIGDPFDFISRFVELDEQGRGHCPFHPPDVHPSFAVNRRLGHWVCFHELNPRTGRYTGGDVIEFYRRLQGLSHKDAVRELRQLVADAGRAVARSEPE